MAFVFLVERFAFFESRSMTNGGSFNTPNHISAGETLRACRSHRIFCVSRRGASFTTAPRQLP
jgi:hypothetical protein